MFPDAVYTRAWADGKRRELGNCDPGLLERCVNALTLLGHLAESGLPFLFKGGTSLLLHLPRIQRLSVDIDIVSPAADVELERVVTQIGRTWPFIDADEDRRGAAAEREAQPQRRHFKFWFPSERTQEGRSYVLLDVVQEPHCPHTIITRPIRTPFLTPDREISVQLPTIESLLGDKLTAFAPTTTGVRLRRQGGEIGEVMQVAKQLFDVGVLFEHAQDFAQVALVYDGVQAQESGYRENLHSRHDSLADTFNACLGLTSLRVRKAPPAMFPDTPLLDDGLNRLTGHLTRARLTDNDRRILGARGAFLAAHLRAGVAFDFASVRYAGTPGQLAALRAAPPVAGAHAWIERLKGANAEAYHYLHRAMSL